MVGGSFRPGFFPCRWPKLDLATPRLEGIIGVGRMMPSQTGGGRPGGDETAHARCRWREPAFMGRGRITLASLTNEDGLLLVLHRADVAVVEAADLRKSDDESTIEWLDGAPVGRVLVESEVRARGVVVAKVTAQATTKVLLVEDGSNQAEARASNHGERGVARTGRFGFLPLRASARRGVASHPAKRWPEDWSPGPSEGSTKEAFVHPVSGASHGPPALSRSGWRGARHWSCGSSSALSA